MARRRIPSWVVVVVFAVAVGTAVGALAYLRRPQPAAERAGPGR